MTVTVRPRFSTLALSGPRLPENEAPSEIGTAPPAGAIVIVAEVTSIGPSVTCTGSWISRPLLPVRYRPWLLETPTPRLNPAVIPPSRQQ